MLSIRALPKFGNGIGLHRVSRFISENSIDIGSVSDRSILVVGTNGKGSTSKYVAAGLAEGGRSVGHFSSPHLYAVYERIAIDGEPISPSDFRRIEQSVMTFARKLAEGGDEMGEFEALFLIALTYFVERDADAIAWEAGIGGRYDPTRVVRARIGILTSIELEHTAILGSTKELIAYDKLDGFPEGARVVCGALDDPDLKDRIQSYAALRRLQNLLFVEDAIGIDHAEHSVAGTSFDTEDSGVVRRVNLAMAGRYQISNFNAALLAVKEFLSLSPNSERLDRIRDRMAAVTWPGRLEKIDLRYNIWIDVGHTPDAIEQTVAALDDMLDLATATLVFGISRGRDAATLVDLVDGRFASVIVAQANHKGAQAADIAECFARTGGVSIEADVERVVDRIRNVTERDEGRPVVVLGSLFLAVEFAHLWRGGNLEDLDFF